MTKALKEKINAIIAILTAMAGGIAPVLLNVNWNGNKKLKNTDKVRFAIFNIPAQITCPFATEMCKKYCYAKKAERVYPSVLPSRARNLEATKKDTFVTDMIYTLEKGLLSKKCAGKRVIVRVHESGDFYSPEYFQKWLQVATYFDGKYDNITFTAYTKSVSYLVEVQLPDNFNIMFSLWEDTDPRQYEIAQALHLPVYTADTENNIIKRLAAGEKFFKCECKDCGGCCACYDGLEDLILCGIH